MQAVVKGAGGFPGSSDNVAVGSPCWQRDETRLKAKNTLVYIEFRTQTILALRGKLRMDLLARRLKEARKQAGLSQEKLGVLAGIDEMSASARMNQYERGKHTPDFGMVQRIAVVLDVPAAYFYAEEDELAALLVKVHHLTKAQRNELHTLLDEWAAHVDGADDF